MNGLAPDAADWRALEPRVFGPPLAPVFTQHYHYRVLEPPKVGGSAVAQTDGFVSARTPPRALAVPHIIGLLEAWWPALYVVEDGVRPMSTVTFMAEIMTDVSRLDPAVPLRYRGRVEAANDGYVLEFRELWSDQQLVALNQQTFVIIK
jgi:hypothetical protein